MNRAELEARRQQLQAEIEQIDAQLAGPYVGPLGGLAVKVGKLTKGTLFYLPALVVGPDTGVMCCDTEDSRFYLSMSQPVEIDVPPRHADTEPLQTVAECAQRAEVGDLLIVQAEITKLEQQETRPLRLGSDSWPAADLPARLVKKSDRGER